MWRGILQLKSDSLQCLGRTLHDLLACKCAAGERDLVWAGMGSQPWTEIVIAREDLDDTRREELLSELTELEIAVRSERRGLDDDGVACEDRWSNLATRKMDGEVPGDCRG